MVAPVAPDGTKPRTCWPNTVAAMDGGQRGGYEVRGEHLPAGAEALLAMGTLMIAVDRRTPGLALPGWCGAPPRAPQDAEVTVSLGGPVRDAGGAAAELPAGRERLQPDHPL